jgi:hypothetical protein
MLRVGGELATRGRAVLVVLALAGGLGVGATAHVALGAESSAAAFPGGTYFVVQCSSTHRNNDDPIVFPGQPGRSHNHTYTGNRSTDAHSTPASLRDNPSHARCGPKTDASAYWFPTLFSDGDPVRPLVSVFYYVHRANGTIRPFPPGLKMIAGDADAKRAQSRNIALWTCGPPIGSRRYAAPRRCPESQFLHMTITFPDCWDGRRLDSRDHKSHMAYSSGRQCPSSHPVEVPAMIMLILYPATYGKLTLSSGPYSAHGDFINAWDQDALATLVERMNY